MSLPIKSKMDKNKLKIASEYEYVTQNLSVSKPGSQLSQHDKLQTFNIKLILSPPH